MSDFDFSENEVQRYARHIVLKEVGGTGQMKLKRGRVLIVGAGGLGSPLAMYLAAAGVGTIGIVDADTVELSNLQRQIAHGMKDIGTPKVDSAKATMADMNPEVTVQAHNTRLDASNVLDLIADYDVIADGSDNFDTRFLLNDACYHAGKTLVSGAALRFDGQVSTFKAHLGVPHPCYRCIYHAPPPEDAIPSCAQGGVLGSVVGMVGGIQATEVLKELMGIGDGLSGQLLIIDALSSSFRKIRVPRDPGCPTCSENATIKDLSIHEH
ncbi:HesA/MoeB/ThiF family protein [Thalassospira profundimaris]|uniref:HesA/MoeB/ThiF family protein n=1 Tax=Thalassospira profundimaris TaxID=502049 RepID=UPI0002872558|nr:molybdopterin-synthase adenylyltransferase MoeB [Thalassospira profundimaris]EKF10214.1 molybdopterin biosynthesis protein MoeB [Thalassospira profundimaris WP0211]